MAAAANTRRVSTDLEVSPVPAARDSLETDTPVQISTSVLRITEAVHQIDHVSTLLAVITATMVKSLHLYHQLSCVLSVDLTMQKVAWKSSTTMSGELFVMMVSMMLTLASLADLWDTGLLTVTHSAIGTDPEPVKYGWMTSSVGDTNHPFPGAVTTDGEFTTAITVKMCQ